MPTSYDPGVDYSALIAQEAAKGVGADRSLLAAYETARNAKIAGEGLSYEQTHIYTREAGRPRLKTQQTRPSRPKRRKLPGHSPRRSLRQKQKCRGLPCMPAVQKAIERKKERSL